MKRQRRPTDELLLAEFSMEGVSESDVRYTLIRRCTTFSSTFYHCDPVENLPKGEMSTLKDVCAAKVERL